MRSTGLLLVIPIIAHLKSAMPDSLRGIHSFQPLSHSALGTLHFAAPQPNFVRFTANQRCFFPHGKPKCRRKRGFHPKSRIEPLFNRENDFQNLQNPLEIRLRIQCPPCFAPGAERDFITKSRLAEREGFEPTLPLKGNHAFQACALNHSAISPRIGTDATRHQACYSHESASRAS